MSRTFTGRHFATLKLFLIGFLGLLLLVPLMMVSSTVDERKSRHDEAVEEVGKSWGAPQTIAGPVLVVPVRQTWIEKTADAGKVVERAEQRIINAYFFPEDLSVDATVKSERRKRGIFEAVVYTGDVTLEGRFTRPDFSNFDFGDHVILWNQAFVAVAVSDLRGTRGRVALEWAGSSIEMQPGSLVTNRRDGMHAPIAGLENVRVDLPFHLKFGINGSQQIMIAPAGKQNHTVLRSNWASPKFFGNFLPVNHRIDADGFEAAWDVSYFGRSHPQSWSDIDSGGGFSGDLAEYGVELLNQVDAYRQTERALKYGVLFLAVTFGVFFLFEVLLALRIHPIQYGLVGACLIVFYLLLLALAEVIGFGPAYAAAVLLSVGAVTVYIAPAVGTTGRALRSGAGAVAGYAYLYILLQLEDLALLFGTIALFAILTAVMIATRKVDWYNLGGPGELGDPGGQSDTSVR